MRVTPSAVNSRGQHGLGKAGGHEALRCQVVDLAGPILLEDGDKLHLVEQVALHDLDAVRMCSMRSKLLVLVRRTMPMTR